MSEFHDDFPQYEVMSNHDEAHGKKLRKTIWMVFFIMLVVTIFEILFGLWAAEHGISKTVLKVVFISLTLVKAYYIVYKFMHLGDEAKWTKWVIIAPYSGFILYLVAMMTIGEGNYSKTARHDLGAGVEQAAGEHGGGEHK